MMRRVVVALALASGLVEGFVHEVRRGPSARALRAETETKTKEKKQSAADQVKTTGFLAAATIAASAVNQAISNTDLSAPDVGKSYVAIRTDALQLDSETGLPMSYNKEAIEVYWKSQGNALQQRWGDFLKVSVPFLVKVATLLVQGGSDALSANDAELARDAREICEKLGPTFIKLAQTLSVRPDVLPQAALDELAVLQDNVKPFETALAIELIEKELGPVSEFFAEISPEPVAAASLAQVYRARLVSRYAKNDTEAEWVAVKVQRPNVVETVSKDLYVLRRAVEVYQRLMDQFAPQQRTNYVALLNEWSIGFYTELDFRSEVENQRQIRKILVEDDSTKVAGVYVPKIYDELSTSRVAVTEWIDGVKLSECTQGEVKALTPIAQEAFLVQLLEAGVFHADPHPGNLFKMRDGRLALLDFGLVARVRPDDQDAMVNTIIHLANKDFASLVDDFIQLEILPKDTSRKTVIPLMDKALSPYIAGGGAKKFEQRVRASYGLDDGASAAIGGFQAMTQDALTVLNDIPFSIPPYFALLGRAVITLEGIALTGDADYALIMEAFPFVSRKLLSSDRPALRSALREALYGDDAKASKKLDLTRLVALVSSALNEKRDDGVERAFIDLDAYAANATQLAKYVLSDDAEQLRDLLVDEAVIAADVLSRQAARRLFDRFAAAAQPSLPFFGTLDFLPNPATQRGPLLIPPQLSGAAAGTMPRLVMTSPRELVDLLAPALTRDDELFALDLVNVLQTTDLLDAGTRALLLAPLEGRVPATSAVGTLLGLAPLANDVFSLSARLPAALADALQRLPRSDSPASPLADILGELHEEELGNLRAATAKLTSRLSEQAADRLRPLV
ncbi:ABC1 family-domain-containing protein [Pelagophyceae sp. CCMP2097]|nr:ABC1 family-domain-containing protein [Pelagophyceae sp. CCMP2097]